MTVKKIVVQFMNLIQVMAKFRWQDSTIPQADPGYDWLFGHGIVGLITKYGEQTLIWLLEQQKLVALSNWCGRKII